MSLQQNLLSRERKSPSPYAIDNNSAGEVRIEELSENDMGYDADVEIVRPDQYEDAESETDEEHENDGHDVNSLEDELAMKLKQLHCDMDHKRDYLPAGQERGRKRLSREMQNPTLAESSQAHLSDFEIMELVNESQNGPPIKRRKARNLARAAAAGRSHAWLHDSIYQESSNNSMAESAAESINSATPGEGDAMVIG